MIVYKYISSFGPTDSIHIQSFFSVRERKLHSRIFVVCRFHPTFSRSSLSKSADLLAQVQRSKIAQYMQILRSLQDGGIV